MRRPVASGTRLSRRRVNAFLRGIAFVALIFTAGTISAAAQSAWEPTEQMKQSVVQETRAFWEIMDAGRFDQAYTRLSPWFQSQITLPQFQEVMASVVVQGGTMITRRLTKVTWYRRPGPDGIVTSFAAVDFAGSLQRAETYCGFLIWHVPDSGPMAVLRIEQNFLPKSVREKMTDAQIAELKKSWRCPE